MSHVLYPTSINVALSKSEKSTLLSSPCDMISSGLSSCLLYLNWHPIISSSLELVPSYNIPMSFISLIGVKDVTFLDNLASKCPYVLEFSLLAFLWMPSTVISYYSFSPEYNIFLLLEGHGNINQSTSPFSVVCFSS